MRMVVVRDDLRIQHFLNSCKKAIFWRVVFGGLGLGVLKLQKLAQAWRWYRSPNLSPTGPWTLNSPEMQNTRKPVKKTPGPYTTTAPPLSTRSLETQSLANSGAET